MALTTQQNDAIKELDRSVCVIAGAGTGKTRILVERFIRLLESGATLDELVAITFTEAAAAEMLERLRRECRQRADAAADEAWRRIWRQHQWGLSAQHVSTIHSFCRRIISRYPVELGLDPQFGIISRPDQQRALTTALLETLQTAAEENDESLAALTQSYSVAMIKKLLRHVVERRMHLMPFLELRNKPVEALAAEWLARLDQQRAEAIAAVVADETFARSANLLAAVSGHEDDLCEALRVEAVSLLAELGDGGGNSWNALRKLAAMGKRKVGRKTSWASAELLADVQAALAYVRAEAASRVEPLEFADADEILNNLRLGQHIAHLGMKVIERFQASKLSVGLLDFDDLLVLTDDLLRHNPPICQRIGQRYRQILVDELQDTDALQLSILSRLIGCGEAGEFKPRAGTFFGVGDPKQSIYRFRGADVNVFRGIMNSFGPKGTRMLSQTFRFHRGLATTINRLFVSVLGRDSFDELEAADATNPAHSAEVLIALADKESARTVDERSELEAAMVSRRIVSLVENGEAEYGDIAILMQRHKTGYYFEEAFKRCGIPYCVIGGQRFYQQQEIRDATSALRVLRNPGDDLALATVLRSPYFGISDNSLYRLRATGKSLREALGADDVLKLLDADDMAKATRARQWLNTFSRRAGRIGIARLMEEALFETGLAHVTLPQFLGLQRYANLRRLMEMARDHDRSGNPRLEDFLASVEQVILEAVEESEAPLSEIGDDAVRLMSIHKAKGLEFRHVFLVNCDYKRSGGAGDVLYPVSGIGLAPQPPDRLKRQKPAGRTIYNAEVFRERMEEQDEFGRLFYVAATRAQQRLYVCGAVVNGKGATGWLKWMWDGLGLNGEGTGDVIEPLDQKIELRDTLGHLTAVHVTAMDVEPLQERGTVGNKAVALEAMTGGRLDEGMISHLRETALASRVDQLSRAVGPITVPAGVLRLSVTALSDYVRCPALFRYRHVLRIPDLPWPQDDFSRSGASAVRSAGGVSVGGAVLGTIVHAVLAEADAEEMECWRRAADRIVAQSPDVAPGQREATLDSVMEMLRVYADETGLPRELRAARKIYRELPFALKLGPAIISGKIDLLYQAENGQWRLVDFKTDRIVPQQDALNSGGYGVQMLVYRLAAEKFLNTKLENTCLLFIRSGKLTPSEPIYDGGHITSLVSLILRESFSAVKPCHTDCQFSGLC